MKLVSRYEHPAPSRRTRPAFPAIHWLRSRSGFERALLLKVLLVLLVAGIAIWAVGIMAHTMQALTDGIDK